jgi:hypothetical protein
LSNIKSIIPLLEVLSPEELIIFSSLIGIVSTKDLNPTEKRVLADLLFVIASTILALASFEDLLIEPQAPNTDMQTNVNTLVTEQEKTFKQMEELQKQIQEIQLRLEKISKAPIAGL